MVRFEPVLVALSYLKLCFVYLYILIFITNMPIQRKQIGQGSCIVYMNDWVLRQEARLMEFSLFGFC